MSVELELVEFMRTTRNRTYELQRQVRALACWLFSWMAFYSSKCLVISECSLFLSYRNGMALSSSWVI